MKALKHAALAALLTLAVASSYADQTNLVQNLRVQLLGVSQGGTFSNANVTTVSANYVTVDTRRVIAALGAATATSFSPASRLVIVRPLNGAEPTFQVRDTSVTVDVTGFLAYQASDSVVSSVVNNRSGRSFSSLYNIQRLALQDNPNYSALNLHFDVNGFAVQNSTGGGNDLNVDVAGTGDRNGALVVFQGSIQAHGGTLEVVSVDQTD